MPTTVQLNNVNEWEEGGVVTLSLLVTVPVQAFNPEFDRDDVIDAAESNMSEVADWAMSHFNVTFSEPYEVTDVRPW